MSGREEALKLIKERDLLENQIEDTRQALKSLGVSPNEQLVTPDGYPRGDIDVATARQLRVQLIRQENDMKSLLDRIRISLNNAFPPKESTRSANSDRLAAPRSFCVVKSVLSGSLGDEAGLSSDDEIIKFGNAKSVSDLSSEFSRSVDSTLAIEVFRPRTEETLRLNIAVTPGRTLGCHIVPK